MLSATGRRWRGRCSRRATCGFYARGTPVRRGGLGGAPVHPRRWLGLPAIRRDFGVQLAGRRLSGPRAWSRGRRGRGGGRRSRSLNYCAIYPLRFPVIGHCHRGRSGHHLLGRRRRRRSPRTLLREKGAHGRTDEVDATRRLLARPLARFHNTRRRACKRS